jgi:hypothetical protein
VAIWLLSAESPRHHQETIKSLPSWDNLVTGSSLWVPMVTLVDRLLVADCRGRRHIKMPTRRL